jgi:nitroreductase
MDAIECLKTRRSIRKFKSTPIPQEIVDDILDCAIKAPSGCNTQPWSFVIVKDETTRKALSKIQPYSSFVAQAPLCIVACFSKGENLYSPSGYLSIAAATENILLAAHSYGLGACWTYVKDFDDPSVENKARKILDIPDDIEVICMIPMGYPDMEAIPKKLKNVADILHNEKW